MSESNVREVVPFLAVASMEAAVRFYVDGLGFTMTNQWIDEGVLRWCRLQLGGAGLMLQEFRSEGHDARPIAAVRGSAPPRGEGVTLCFMCADALAIYHGARACGLAPARPFVGNAMWVTELTDPDGYKILFESDTDAPEESVYEEG